jgi:hypothetical protein
MSWGTCYSYVNSKINKDIKNLYPNIIQNGGLITNNTSFVNDKINENMESNNDYRHYLMNNANTIMNKNRQEAFNQVGICKYGSPSEIKSNGKYLYKSNQDLTEPFGYENSDLKTLYLSREALHSRLSAPLMSQQEYLTLPRG